MHPTIFKLGPFVFSTIWIFVLISVYVFLKLLVRSIQKKREDFKFLYENSTFLIIWFIIGARVSHIGANMSYYFYDISLQSFFSLFAIWDKGFSFWGGLIFALLAMYYATRKHKESFTKWADYIAEPFLYALPISYIGKFFDGMGYGSKTDLPIGIAFKNMNVAIISPVHPTQLYGAAMLVAVIFGVRHLNKTRPDLMKISGMRTSVVVGLIAATLFIEHWFRGDPTLTIFGIRFTIYLSFIIAVACGINIRKLTR